MHVVTRAGSIPAIVMGTLLATVTLPADAQQRNDRRVRVDTLDSGRIVVSSPDSPQRGAPGPPGLVEVLRIGSVDGTCDAFGEVTSIAVDGDGRIYVADRQANEIRVFSPQGECVRTFGRSGEGPGEFSWLAGITWQPPGNLWAIDAIRDRFTVFDSLGTVLATHRLQLGRATSLPWPLWVDDEQNLHLWLPASRTIVKYGVGPGLDSLASFQVPEIPRENVYPANGWITAQSPIPYSPSIRWTVNRAGNVWLASGLEAARIPAGSRLTTYRTARSAFPAGVLDPAGPRRESGKAGPEWRDSRSGRMPFVDVSSGMSGAPFNQPVQQSLYRVVEPSRS